MRSTTKRMTSAGARIAVAAVATAGALLTSLVAAPSASAAVRYCPGTTAWCAQVTGINSGSRLLMRVDPYYGSEVTGVRFNGDWLHLECWTTGDADADGHGYRYWMLVSGVGGGDQPIGYVNDWYLDSGGYAQWSKVISHC
ncbi:hypothetical protein [Streptomyces sp. S465]|uniref:hypothetical protein n=1 Tax=Streptomyces sp. S465 TaxID=2979468 RepID=UPI0022A80C7F|nr:hypothetical protein [Streptomyces sp. S465]WAP53689.1 hypothetical protein N6H00_01270 [Streptomyces sp. S465]